MSANSLYNWILKSCFTLLASFLLTILYLLRHVIFPSWIESFVSSHEQSLITIIGWLAIAILGIWAAKIQLRNSARLEIYKEIYGLKQKVDQKALMLGLTLNSFQLPFNDMDYAESNMPELRNLVQNRSAGEIWIDHFRKINEQKSEFSDAYLQFWNHLGIWRAELSSLSLAQDIMFTELNRVSGVIQRHAEFLLNIQVSHYKWKEWDRPLIESRSDTVRSDFDQTTSYVSDFMDLVHGELIRPIFGRTRVPRQDYNYRESIVSKTLTKNGLKDIKYPATRIATLRIGDEY